MTNLTRSWLLLCGVLSTCSASLFAGDPDGNRLTYLDDPSPYYVSRTFPKLITPQWVGEPGVEAVVVLAIDDMTESAKWEKYLRPILNRLKQIDGRAPASIMCNTLKTDDPHLQQWLAEGLSLEVHTMKHPCPLLQGGDFEKAKWNVHECIDQMAKIPGNKAVAYRMPCCDGLNSVSPRFFAEIFNEKTKEGHFLQIDSSVFVRLTSNDPELPRHLVRDPDGQERFGKYIPNKGGRTFINYVDDYPYPYIVNKLCWEFPCIVPSDYEGQLRNKPNSPQTVADLKAALDAVVIKKGVYNLVFHPHGWIKAEQVVELIDHAVKTHGSKVKFLTFQEALKRLDQNLLQGISLRSSSGADNGVRLLDLNNDGYLDAVIGNEHLQQTRMWLPDRQVWKTSQFPIVFPSKGRPVQFGTGPQREIIILNPESPSDCSWSFIDGGWKNGPIVTLDLLEMMPADESGDPDEPLKPAYQLRDIDHDGVSELIYTNSKTAVFRYDPQGLKPGSKPLPITSAERVSPSPWRSTALTFPQGLTAVGANARDVGLRFVDVNEDGFDDLLMSNESEYALYLFTDVQHSWSQKVFADKQSAKPFPIISRNGKNSGAWIANRTLWVQNENTDKLADLVDRRTFNQMLETVTPTAKSAEASLKSIRMRDGFQIELAAAEPLTMDPVCITFGHNGKLWVVEMADYPLGMDGKGKFGGRVRYLEDTNGDGKYDKSTLFLDGLGFPNGIAPYKNGVLVTCAPDIFYAEDTDGDGKADKREVLFTGFAPANQQHRVNGLIWGLDNRFYCANGDGNGSVKSIKTGNVIDIRGRDLCFDPETGEIELQTGVSQFGRNRDDWGTWFGCQNPYPMFQFVLDEKYLGRNPHIAPPPRWVHVPVVPPTAPVYPVSRTPERFNDAGGANRFTSANSVIVYRDDLFPAPFSNSMFVSEPVHNLIHLEVIEHQGIRMVGRRAIDEERSEFLASSDNWFRPTTIRVGPDGALWVADMYRQVIEHPEWIPKDVQAKLDLRAGHDKGRIYRVSPVGEKRRPIPRLDKLNAIELAKALDSSSGWQRDMAQQLLIERQDKSAVETLIKQFRTSSRPQCRMHSLCALDGLHALTDEHLQQALQDPHPGVRRQALRLCEPWLKKDPGFGNQWHFDRLAKDRDAAVQFQLAYTMGEWPSGAAGAILHYMACDADRVARWQKGADPAFGPNGTPVSMEACFQAAIASSLNKQNLKNAWRMTVAKHNATHPELGDLRTLFRANILATAIGLQNDDVLQQGLDALATPVDGKTYDAWQLQLASRLIRELARHNQSLDSLKKRSELSTRVDKLAGLFQYARRIAADNSTGIDSRRQALVLVGSDPANVKADIDLLLAQLTPTATADWQQQVLEALLNISSPEVADKVIAGWRSYGPQLRTKLLDLLISREDGAKKLVQAIAAGTIPAAEIDVSRRRLLIEHPVAEVRSQSAKILEANIDRNRQKVIDDYASALTLKGDLERGVAVFTKTCAVCHQVKGIGKSVGPDITALSDRSPKSLLTAILDPNRAVETKFIGYTAVTKGGRSHSGILSSESGGSVTLIGADGKTETLLRAELEELASSGKSLMPEGVEKDVPPQAMADLLAFLTSTAPPRKIFEGNAPEVIRPLTTAQISLPARRSEIYGDTLTFKLESKSLETWNSLSDVAVWTVEIPAPSKYTVQLDWACEDRHAGNQFVLAVGEQKLRAYVRGTGGSDLFRRENYGELTLPAGRHRISIRPQVDSHPPLMRLREIRLFPAPK